MVEGARLEIVWAGDRLGGSNPLASATFFQNAQKVIFGSRASRSMRILSYAMALAELFFVGFFLERLEKVAVSAETIFAGDGIFENSSLHGL